MNSGIVRQQSLPRLSYIQQAALTLTHNTCTRHVMSAPVGYCSCIGACWYTVAKVFSAGGAKPLYATSCYKCRKRGIIFHGTHFFFENTKQQQKKNKKVRYTKKIKLNHILRCLFFIYVQSIFWSYDSGACTNHRCLYHNHTPPCTPAPH